MSDEELIARLREFRSNQMADPRTAPEFVFLDPDLPVSEWEKQYSMDVIYVRADRIEALTEQLSAARQDAKAAEDELEMQEQEACMMENDYIKLEKERDAIEAKLARAEWLLTDAAVQLEDGKIKTRRNRAGLIWQFLEEIKGESHE